MNIRWTPNAHIRLRQRWVLSGHPILTFGWCNIKQLNSCKYSPSLEVWIKIHWSFNIMICLRCESASFTWHLRKIIKFPKKKLTLLIHIILKDKELLKRKILEFGNFTQKLFHGGLLCMIRMMTPSFFLIAPSLESLKENWVFINNQLWLLVPMSFVTIIDYFFNYFSHLVVLVTILLLMCFIILNLNNF